MAYYSNSRSTYVRRKAYKTSRTIWRGKPTVRAYKNILIKELEAIVKKAKKSAANGYPKQRSTGRYFSRRNSKW